MNIFHQFAVSVLALGLSGIPAPAAEAVHFTNTEIADSYREPNELIPWSVKRLAWEDFLCEPKKGTEAVASTSTSLGIAYQMQGGRLSYDITCHFSKTKSWGLMKTDYILAHEQGHFDITEIFARKLNEALQNYEFNKRTFKNDISEIYQSIVRQKEEFQKMYDGETDHSRRRKTQYDWLEKIHVLLDETEHYATYP
ncbi:MAG: DUF922 domain-containing protein [Flavisolibacter sp.]